MHLQVKAKNLCWLAFDGIGVHIHFGLNQQLLWKLHGHEQSRMYISYLLYSIISVLRLHFHWYDWFVYEWSCSPTITTLLPLLFKHNTLPLRMQQIAKISLADKDWRATISMLRDEMYPQQRPSWCKLHMHKQYQQEHLPSFYKPKQLEESNPHLHHTILLTKQYAIIYSPSHLIITATHIIFLTLSKNIIVQSLVAPCGFQTPPEIPRIWNTTGTKVDSNTNSTGFWNWNRSLLELFQKNLDKVGLIFGNFRRILIPRWGNKLELI